MNSIYKPFEKIENVVNALKVMARRNCDYRNPREPMKRQRCDCKYGISQPREGEALGTYHSEESGCPELQELMYIIATIPKKDWEKIIKRANTPRAMKRVMARVTS